MSGIVTLLTDFGTREPFVGVMKGVLLARHPEARLVDLTHEIAPQRVCDGAFWLGLAYPWFAAGTVHLAVVDPGVGSERRALVARADGQLFVAPDNGLLERVRKTAGSFEARAVEPSALGLEVPARTFHGRDLFAPVAGELAAGRLAFEAVGIVVEPLATNLLPEPRVSAESGGGGSAEGEVVLVDHFGNLVTNLEGPALTAIAGARIRLLEREIRLVGTYAELAEGECGALVGSFGQLEVVARDARAATRLGAGPGARVRLDW